MTDIVRSRIAARRLAATLVTGSLALLVLAGCGSAAPAAANHTATSPSTSASTSIAPAAPTTTAATAATAATTASVPATQNLDATPTVKQQLADAYAASMQLSTTFVAGTVPGTTYYAYDAENSTYYAVAAIQPSAAYLAQRSSLPAGEQAAFQDGPPTFSRTQGGAWTLQGNGVLLNGDCAGIPAAVVEVWNMTPGHCTFSDVAPGT